MTQADFKGSCLCRSVEYEFSGDPARFYHCHCKRCRKATGTGHASNLIVKADAIHWIKGKELVSCYKVPEAERFTNCFCTQCGSGVPRHIAALNIVVIPVGSLDSEPPIKPQARIFWDSRADWSCNSEELPVYAEYPPL